MRSRLILAFKTTFSYDTTPLWISSKTLNYERCTEISSVEILFPSIWPNNASEALVYSWCLNRPMMNIRQGGQEIGRECSNQTE